MAIPYQLSPLYQLIVNTRTRQQVPPEDEFANHLEEIERKIIAAFEAIRNQPHSKAEFTEFINDHYLSLLDYQDRLFRISGVHYDLLCNSINNLKSYMKDNYNEILDSPVPNTHKPPFDHEQNGIKDWFKRWLN